MVQCPEEKKPRWDFKIGPFCTVVTNEDFHMNAYWGKGSKVTKTELHLVDGMKNVHSKHGMPIVSAVVEE